MFSRIIWTVLLLAASIAFDHGANLLEPLVTGPAAVAQFDNSALGYVSAMAAFGLFPWLKVGFTLVCFLLIFNIWRRYAAGLVLILLFLSQPAYAYYDKTNYTEVYFILPNESAFFIPDVGDNKDTQGAFGSEAYLKDKKIAAKRFEIPHAKLPGTAWFSDYYVPTGRLIVVDRTPFNKEWTKSSTRGTAAHDQSMPCQSGEGLNITAEITVAASVTEENAPKFLYNFGVKLPEGDRSKPEVIFASVYQGKSLAEVMDSVGRGMVQSVVCDELSLRSLDKANAEMPAVMAAIRTKASAFLATRGITLDYVGWAGTFEFDLGVQKAINDRYEADKIAPVIQTLQARADILVREGLGTGLGTKGLPASLIAIPEHLLGDLSAMFGGSRLVQQPQQGGK